MGQASSNRAPLLLSLVILLGVGGRWLRGDEAPRADQQSGRVALDSQLAQVERAGGKGRGKKASSGRRQNSKKGPIDSAARGGRPSRSARRGASADSAGKTTVRSETTPLGAVSPEWRPRMEGSGRVGATSGNRGAGTGAARRSKQRRVERAPASGRRSGDDQSPREPIDLESASAAEIERLPRVGPALARRIVEDRAAHGPFRSLKGLQRVRGIGPALARHLQGHVTFGGTGRP